MSFLLKGFTLVEMMIVVIIVGVLAAFAIPMYQEYASEAQMNRAYREVAAVKHIISVIASRGGEPTTTSTDVPSASMVREYIGHDVTLSNLIETFTISRGTLAPTGDGAYNLTATLGGSASSNIAGVQITLLRSSSGIWECQVHTNSVAGWKNKFAPTSCTIL